MVCLKEDNLVVLHMEFDNSAIYYKNKNVLGKTCHSTSTDSQNVCCCVNPVGHIRKQQVVNPKRPNSATIGNQPSLKDNY